jgi:exodeoxyribonuclease VII large subunit
LSDNENTSTAPNAPEYSVTELSFALKRTVEDTFGYVRVRGEISGLARPRSGHVYFALKDDKSVMDSVCWKGIAGRLRFDLEDGLEVICTGKLSTYPQRSKYQLVVERMEPAGIGALLAQLEERRKRLAAEGLFDESRKQPIPYLPKVIGVVTSPTGAVIRDILHRLRDRFPRQVLLWPVLVQGEGAATQVAAAIEGFNRMPADGPTPRPDLLIVARGGGSIEDLWSFNEEIVVRAAAASEIPLISAVGHETDTTLIDHASDRRAPTPTAAAEMAVPVRADLASSLRNLEDRQTTAVRRLLENRKREIEGLSRGLRGPRELLSLASQRYDDIGDRLYRSILALRNVRDQRLATLSAAFRPNLLQQDIGRQGDRLNDLSTQLSRAFQQRITDGTNRLALQSKLLESLSYQNVLERGFALVHEREGGPLTRIADIHPGQAITVEFYDGRADATFGDGKTTSPPPAATAPKKVRQKKKAKDDGQGTLL